MRERLPQTSLAEYLKRRGVQIAGRAFLTGTLLATGCSPKNENLAEINLCPQQEVLKAEPRTTRSIINSEVFSFIKDKNPDPLFRASSVFLFEINPETRESSGYGQAFLTEQDGKYCLTTAFHVIEGHRVAGWKTVNAYVPGVGISILKLDDFRSVEPSGAQFNDGDKLASYLLPDAGQEETRKMVEEGLITPLKVASRKPKLSEEVFVSRPDIGQYIRFRVQALAPVMQLSSINPRYVPCQGQSGAAIFNKETGEVYGLLIEGIQGPDGPKQDPLDIYPRSNAECSPKITAYNLRP